jgi:hypothetical protein
VIDENCDSSAQSVSLFVQFFQEIGVRAVVLTAFLPALLLLGSGCSTSRCEAVCEKFNACALSERPTDVECSPYCSDVESLQLRAESEGQENCDPLWQEHLSCLDSNSAMICDTTFTDCADKAKAWTTCMTSYCAAVASQKKTDPNCSSGKPTLTPF